VSDKPMVEQVTASGRLHLDGPTRGGARRVWDQVLTYYLAEHGGGSVDSLAGNMGCFYLQLTRQETCDLFESAKGAADDPIKQVEGQQGATGDAQRWKATEKWATRGARRAASGAEMRPAVPGVVKSTTGRILAGLSAAAMIGAAFGVGIKPGTPEAKLLLADGSNSAR
jgi:hypothetical protein